MKVYFKLFILVLLFALDCKEKNEKLIIFYFFKLELNQFNTNCTTIIEQKKMLLFKN